MEPLFSVLLTGSADHYSNIWNETCCSRVILSRYAPTDSIIKVSKKITAANGKRNNEPKRECSNIFLYNEWNMNSLYSFVYTPYDKDQIIWLVMLERVYIPSEY
jgi:hypothetical protein